MNKTKSVITSMLIMIPIGGIMVFLYQTSVWTAQPFVLTLAAFGFYNLWRLVFDWLRTPETVKEKPRTRHTAPAPAKKMTPFDIELENFINGEDAAQ